MAHPTPVSRHRGLDVKSETLFILAAIIGNLPGSFVLVQRCGNRTIEHDKTALEKSKSVSTALVVIQPVALV
jgi:hypothetical protein